MKLEQLMEGVPFTLVPMIRCFIPVLSVTC